MTLADYGKHVREDKAESADGGVRQRGGASSSTGPAPAAPHAGRQGEKREDEAEEQLNPLSPLLKEVAINMEICRVVIERGEL